jgi:hypothetical protein
MSIDIDQARELHDIDLWEKFHGGSPICPCYPSSDCHYFKVKVRWSGVRVLICRCGLYKCSIEECEEGVEEHGDICADHVTCQHEGCKRLPMVGNEFCDLHDFDED